MPAPLAVGVAGALFVALLAAAEAATRRWKLDAEVSRRLVHLSCGVACACLPLVMSLTAVVVLALMFIPFMAVSRRVGLFPAVHGVERATWGEVYFPLGVLLAAALSPSAPPYAYGVLVMGVSDPFASFAGQRHGRRRYRVLAADKTYVGSAVFFSTTLAVTIAALAVTAGVSTTTLLAAPVLAAVLTVVEGVCGAGLDNVVLPVAGSALLQLAT